MTVQVLDPDDATYIVEGYQERIQNAEQYGKDGSSGIKAGPAGITLC